MNSKTESKWKELFEWLKETGYTPGQIGDIVMDKIVYSLGSYYRLKANNITGYDPTELEKKIAKLEKATF